MQKSFPQPEITEIRTYFSGLSFSLLNTPSTSRNTSTEISRYFRYSTRNRARFSAITLSEVSYSKSSAPPSTRKTASGDCFKMPVTNSKARSRTSRLTAESASLTRLLREFRFRFFPKIPPKNERNSAGSPRKNRPISEVYSTV